VFRIRVATGSAVESVDRGGFVERAGRSRLIVKVVRVVAGFVFVSVIPGLFVVSEVSVVAGKEMFIEFVVGAVGLLRFVLRVGAVFGRGGVIEEGVPEGHKNNEEVLVIKNFCESIHH